VQLKEWLEELTTQEARSSSWALTSEAARARKATVNKRILEVM
jgi:hypothetical protein